MVNQKITVIAAELAAWICCALVTSTLAVAIVLIVDILAQDNSEAVTYYMIEWPNVEAIWAAVSGGILLVSATIGVCYVRYFGGGLRSLAFYGAFCGGAIGALLGLIVASDSLIFFGLIMLVGAISYAGGAVVYYFVRLVLVGFMRGGIGSVS